MIFSPDRKCQDHSQDVESGLLLPFNHQEMVIGVFEPGGTEA